MPYQTPQPTTQAFCGVKSFILATLLAVADPNGTNPLWPGLGYGGPKGCKDISAVCSKAQQEEDKLFASVTDLSQLVNLGAAQLLVRPQRLPAASMHIRASWVICVHLLLVEAVGPAACYQSRRASWPCALSPQCAAGHPGHMHACAGILATCMHIRASWPHVCIYVRPGHMHMRASWPHACICGHPGHMHAYMGILATCMHIRASWPYGCIYGHPGHMRAYAGILATCMHIRASWPHACTCMHGSLHAPHACMALLRLTPYACIHACRLS